MIKVFHRHMTRSVRILWLLEELGVPYEVEPVERGIGESEEFRKISPTGKMPAIIDGDVSVFDSGAIIEYLLDKYDVEQKFSPPRGSAEWLQYIQWMHGSETFMLPGSLFGHHTVVRSEEDRVPKIAEEGKAEFETNLRCLNRLLSEREYVAGDRFTAADIMLGWCLFVMETVGFGGGLEHIERYSRKLKTRPAYGKIAF